MYSELALAFDGYIFSLKQPADNVTRTWCNSEGVLDIGSCGLRPLLQAPQLKHI